MTSTEPAAGTPEEQLDEANKALFTKYCRVMMDYGIRPTDPDSALYRGVLDDLRANAVAYAEAVGAGRRGGKRAAA